MLRDICGECRICSLVRGHNKKRMGKVRRVLLKSEAAPYFLVYGLCLEFLSVFLLSILCFNSESNVDRNDGRSTPGLPIFSRMDNNSLIINHMVTSNPNTVF